MSEIPTKSETPTRTLTIRAELQRFEALLAEGYASDYRAVLTEQIALTRRYLDAGLLYSTYHHFGLVQGILFGIALEPLPTAVFAAREGAT